MAQSGWIDIPGSGTMVNGRIARRAVLSVCGVLGASMWLASPAMAAPRAAAPHWRVVAQARPGSYLTSLIAPGPTTAWAFGFGASGSGPSYPVGRRWNGHRWTVVR